MTAADARDHLALALVPGLGPRLTAAVLAHFGSPAAALAATAPQLRGVPLIGDKLARQFAEAFRSVDVEPELKLLAAHGVRIIPRGDPDYPARLDAIPDPPALLYLRGDFRPEDANSVGIVGSRACTAYGLKAAAAIAAGLARAGWTVVSGLARGIDGAAHRGALEAGGRTLAALAGGLAKIYPPEHTDLANAVAGNGCLITETPMTVAPQPGMFPARNRVISGISRAIIVVEANIKSGALITVEHAAEQGREVFAVPGNVDSPASAGCLELIRKGAKLVRSADDIIDDLRGIAPPDPPARTPKPATLFDAPPPAERPAEPPPPPPQLDPLQQKIWDALTGPTQADDLARRAGVTAAELSRSLMVMELKKLVVRMPGNVFRRR